MCLYVAGWKHWVRILCKLHICFCVSLTFIAFAFCMTLIQSYITLHQQILSPMNLIWLVQQHCIFIIKLNLILINIMQNVRATYFHGISKWTIYITNWCSWPLLYMYWQVKVKYLKCRVNMQHIVEYNSLSTLLSGKTYSPECCFKAVSVSTSISVHDHPIVAALSWIIVELESSPWSLCTSNMYIKKTFCLFLFCWHFSNSFLRSATC